MKGRGVIIFIILIVLVAAVYLLTRPTRPTFLRRGAQVEELPLNLREVIPDDWSVLSEWQRQCNFDGDEDQEWLIVYRYDQTQVNQPYTKELKANRGPIGGAIFDTQNNVLPEGVGNPSPYAPTFIIPYRLLPDFYEGKGQGYLGETSVTVLYDPAIPRDGACQVNEITVLGYVDGPLPTRLSIFRWQDTATGYAGAHFAGDARVDVNIPATGAVSVQQVTTYNRLANHRSLLCAMRTFNRTDQATVQFTENTDVFSVDFCFDAPPDPAYPEGVVVAYVRGGSPRPRTATSSSPGTNETFRLTSASVPAEIVPATTTRILSLTNPASVNRDPAGGHQCTSNEVTGGINPVVTPGPTPTSVAGGGWICGRETATVETEIIFPGVVRRVVWQLISVSPEQVNGDVYWRIQNAQVVAAP